MYVREGGEGREHIPERSSIIEVSGFVGFDPPKGVGGAAKGAGVLDASCTAIIDAGTPPESPDGLMMVSVVVMPIRRPTANTAND